MPDRAPQPVDRQLPTDEARDLISLVRDIAQREIAPKAAEEEDAGRFPREVFTLLSESGLLGLPYDSEYGGGEQPYEVYLQVLEELARARLTVALGVSVHTLATYPLAAYGTKEQRAEHLPAVLGVVGQAEQAGLGQQGEQLAREAAGFLLLGGPGGDLALRDVADEREQVPGLVRGQ